MIMEQPDLYNTVRELYRNHNIKYIFPEYYKQQNLENFLDRYFGKSVVDTFKDKRRKGAKL